MTGIVVYLAWIEYMKWKARGKRKSDYALVQGR